MTLICACEKCMKLTGENARITKDMDFKEEENIYSFTYSNPSRMWENTKKHQAHVAPHSLELLSLIAKRPPSVDVSLQQDKGIENRSYFP